MEEDQHAGALLPSRPIRGHPCRLFFSFSNFYWLTTNGSFPFFYSDARENYILTPNYYVYAPSGVRSTNKSLFFCPSAEGETSIEMRNIIYTHPIPVFSSDSSWKNARAALRPMCGIFMYLRFFSLQLVYITLFTPPLRKGNNRRCRFKNSK